jgi:hypothetical protein
MRRQVRCGGIPAALLALLVVLGAAWGTPRSSALLDRGAGPAPAYAALPAGINQVAAAPRADPRASAPPAAAPPAPARPLAGAAPAAAAGHSRTFSPAAAAPAGGRSPPAAG